MHDRLILGIALAAMVVAVVALDVRAFLRERRESQARAHADSAIAVTQPAPDLALVDLALWELEMGADR